MEPHSLVESGNVQEQREAQEMIVDWKMLKPDHLGEMKRFLAV